MAAIKHQVRELKVRLSQQANVRGTKYPCSAPVTSWGKGLFGSTYRSPLQAPSCLPQRSSQSDCEEPPG